jgi:oxygen-dependent protoporphyrinogen oxidase
LFPRFADAEQNHGSLLRAFRRRGGPPPSADGAFKSLPGGLSELVCALVAALAPDTVRTDRDVTRIEGNGPFYVEVGGAAYETRAVVLSAPAFAAAAILRDRDQELSRLCAEVPYASIATIALAFPRSAVAHPLNGSGFVVPRTEQSGILAASWLSSKWPHRAPADSVLLRTFVGGARDPHALERTDAELVAMSVAAIRGVLGISGEPTLARVYRFPRASAQHEVGHVERMAAIDRRLEAHPGLFLTGSGFRGVGIPDCIADARATAAQVASWLRVPAASTAKATG